ncbi:MAG: hypothetical protein J0I48_19175 [Devosia sp.]|uniref:hypothetical protein n=1 Tax=Devosia sp. 66-22 TaxID=1895753 RepID=UPI0009280E1C|nr:hypothetical protein [Devosia sp. 66-22]MBN9348289.1 hypothetical protein [Devosia sp.]OJX48970.1 MAG: hypothetical protein BGO81_10270 [Devosia sp. 66-22]
MADDERSFNPGLARPHGLRHVANGLISLTYSEMQELTRKMLDYSNDTLPDKLVKAAHEIIAAEPPDTGPKPRAPVTFPRD